MSNGFADFFETLLPREITLYVLPGSLVLGTILCNPNLYIHQVNCKFDSANTVAVFDKIICNPNAATYTFIGIIWITIAYTIGLTIGAIKAGILYKVIKSWGRLGKEKCDDFGSLLFTLFSDNSPKEKDENLGVAAMYISLHQETMYRREIERYGVFINALENLTVAMAVVIFLIQKSQVCLCFKTSTDKGVATTISVLLLLVLPIGAEGYRKLQNTRIKDLKKAMDAQ
jgi:hypothetical protein